VLADRVWEVSQTPEPGHPKVHGLRDGEPRADKRCLRDEKLAGGSGGKSIPSKRKRLGVGGGTSNVYAINLIKNFRKDRDEHFKKKNTYSTIEEEEHVQPVGPNLAHNQKNGSTLSTEKRGEKLGSSEERKLSKMRREKKKTPVSNSKENAGTRDKKGLSYV